MSLLRDRGVLLGFFVCSALPAQHAIVGHVYGADGEPLAAAEVRASLWDEDREVGRATTAGDGMFVIGGVPGARVRVTATSPGRLPGTAWWHGDSRVRRGEIELTLWDATTVRGRVVDADGAPIAGAEVFADLPEASVPGVGWARTAAGADGEFALTAPLGQLRVQAWAPGFGVGAVVIQARHPEERADLQLVRGAGVEIRVRHLAGDDDGAGAEEIAIEIRGDGPLPLAVAQGRVPRGGEWRATGLPDIGYGVFPSAPDHVCDPGNAFAEMGKGPYDFAFRARPVHRVEMRGRVTDELGRPLAATELVCGMAWTEAHDAGVVTDADGGFVLPATPWGWKCTLRVAGAQLVLMPKRVAVPSRSLEPTLDGRARAAVMPSPPRVRSRCPIEIDDRSALDLLAVPAQKLRGVARCQGRPLARAEVRLEERRSERWWSTGEVCVTGEDGSYEFEGLSVMPGTELCVGVTKGAWFGTATVLCAGECETIAVPSVDVQEGGTLSGTVRDGDRRPLPGVRIRLGAVVMKSFQGTDVPTREPDTPTLEVLSDKEGRYCFRGVRPGEQMLEWQLGGRGSSRGSVAPIEVNAGQRVTRDFEVP
jgi:hypothetical protein